MIRGGFKRLELVASHPSFGEPNIKKVKKVINIVLEIKVNFLDTAPYFNFYFVGFLVFLVKWFSNRF